jgi:hypothetical protein
MLSATKSAGQGTPANFLQEPFDFSLVLGGPTFQLLLRAHLEGDHTELLYRRLLVITLVAWLPLLLLATHGSLTRSTGWLSFFRDVEVHVRFLIALPILIAAELVVHSACDQSHAVFWNAASFSRTTFPASTAL